MNLPLFVFELLVLLFSVVVHEVSHGYAAEKLGDDTARNMGRLTFNPLKHLDLFGSIILPLIFFATNSPVLLGWAKPVPYNPLKLKDQKYSPLKVALAGPAANLALLILFGLLARFTLGAATPALTTLFGLVALLNANLAVLNLIPIPPLDGSKILFLLLPRRYALFMEGMGMSGIFLVLLFLFLFAWIIPAIAVRMFYFVAGGGVLAAMNQALGM